MLSQPQKLMSLTCQCELERQGFPDLAMRKKDKLKVLQVFKEALKDVVDNNTSQVKVYVKYQRTMETGLEFGLRQVQAMFTNGVGKGMLQLMVVEKPVQT